MDDLTTDTALDEWCLTPNELLAAIPDQTSITLPVAFIKEVSETRSLTEALDTITNWLRQMLPIGRASVALDDGKGMLKIWAQQGHTASGLKKSVSVNNGRIGRTFRNRQIILSCDLKLCREVDGQMLCKAGFRRTITTPLIAGRRCFGTLNVSTSDLHGIGLKDALLLHTVAGWIGPVLNSMRDAESANRAMERERDLKQRAESESAAKTSFIANISHEIRTPLNGILGMVQMLRGERGNPALVDTINVMHDSAQSLLTILNDVLDLSKIEAGKLSITPVRNSLPQTLRQTIKLWSAPAAKKGLVLSLTVHPDVPDTMIFDAIRVQQCISNLISNAIKFTDTGQVNVTLSTTLTDSYATPEITVRDTGHGIAPEQVAALFEPFQQGDASMSRRTAGTGLGLPISRRLARMMGGDVTVQSSMGLGSAFTFKFRARVTSHLPSKKPAGTQVPTREIATENALQDRSILLVEDIATNRLVIEMFLANLPITLLHASNGQEALDLLHETDVDLVLLDMHMPVMDGPQTIAAMRASPDRLSRLPVIALTADAMAGDRERFLSLGIDGYVAKPVDANVLISEMQRLLA